MFSFVLQREVDGLRPRETRVARLIFPFKLRSIY